MVFSGDFIFLILAALRPSEGVYGLSRIFLGKRAVSDPPPSDVAPPSREMFEALSMMFFKGVSTFRSPWFSGSAVSETLSVPGLRLSHVRAYPLLDEVAPG